MILDTNALSAFADGVEAVGQLLAAQARACLPVIVLGEYRYGVVRSQRRAEHERWLRTHLPTFEILAVSERTAAVYAELRAELASKGTPIPANDAWIAALALQHGLPVASRDVHFDVVPGVRRVGW